MYWDGAWSVPGARLWACFSVLVIYVGTCVQLLSSLIFCLVSVLSGISMCIVKRHTYLWGADKQPNTNTGFFSGYQGRSSVVILNTTRGTWHWKAHYMRKTRADNYVFHCECLSLGISSLPLNLKWGTGRRSGYNCKVGLLMIVWCPMPCSFQGCESAPYSCVHNDCE